MITRPCKWIYFTYPSEGDSVKNLGLVYGKITYDFKCFNVLVSLGHSKAGILGGWEGKSNTSETGCLGGISISVTLFLVITHAVMQNGEDKVKSC